MGCFIWIGILENQRETNSWFAFFRDGRPLFTRINMNLPYTDRRMATGLEVAGMTVTAIEPLKRARIQFDPPDFAVDLAWDAILPMQDALELTQGGADAGFAKELAHIHMAGPCAVRGTVSLRGGEVMTPPVQGCRTS